MSRSFVIVSNELSHSPIAVHAFLDRIITEGKQTDPDVKMIHYWTDGHKSQQRNKQIFYTVANHPQIYGIQARWNYFKVGHGKGPCDGLGGRTKRIADEAIRSGEAVIPDAEDFFRWPKLKHKTGVILIRVHKCQEISEKLALRKDFASFNLHSARRCGNWWNHLGVWTEELLLPDLYWEWIVWWMGHAYTARAGNGTK